MKAKLLLLLVLISCNGIKSERNDKDSSKIIDDSEIVKNEPQAKDNLKQKVLGIWADGNSENASFIMNSDSIYSVEQFTSYKYKIIDSTITINYPDVVLVGKLSFIKDTMVIESEGEKTKFWKFKN